MILMLFFMMVFCHIVDDFYLQPTMLSTLKQKKFWERECEKENLNFDDYKNDYKVALLIHGFSWSFMVMLPLIVYSLFNSTISNDYSVYVPFLVTNAWIYALVDNEKANKMTMNLVADQSIHLIQIIAAYIGFLAFC